MKKSYVAFLFCLASTIANAQSRSDFAEVPKPVLCGPISIILSNLTNDEIGESPIWGGNDLSGNSSYSIFVNEKKGTFTIIQFNQELGCILGIGDKSQLLNFGKKL
jgi:hypothetical protein